MCWADIRIARSQTIRSSASQLNGSGNTVQYDTWARRVALIISAQGTDRLTDTFYEPMFVQVFTGHNVAATSKLIYSGEVFGKLRIGIEDFGAQIGGHLTVVMDLSGLGSQWCITEMELTDPSGAGNPRGIEE